MEEDVGVAEVEGFFHVGLAQDVRAVFLTRACSLRIGDIEKNRGGGIGQKWSMSHFAYESSESSSTPSLMATI